jgi:hypothetical protein
MIFLFILITITKMMLISKEDFIAPISEEANIIESWSDHLIFQIVSDNSYLVVVDRGANYLCENFRNYDRAANFIYGILV